MKEKFFMLAKEISQLSDHAKYSIGAVITRKGIVISVGANVMKTSPRSPHPFKTRHAEVNAILKARTDLRGCDIYIYRETQDGKAAMAKPCNYCQELIDAAGIRNVYYTNENKFFKL